MRLLPVLLLACACSGGNKKPTATPATRDAGVAATGDADAPNADPRAPLTGADCDAFVDHVVVLAEQQRVAGSKNPDEALTAEELAAVQAKVRASLRAECLNLPRDVWQCAMNAQDPRAYADCAGNQKSHEAVAPK